MAHVLTIFMYFRIGHNFGQFWTTERVTSSEADPTEFLHIRSLGEVFYFCTIQERFSFFPTIFDIACHVAFVVSAKKILYSTFG